MAKSSMPNKQPNPTSESKWWHPASLVGYAGGYLIWKFFGLTFLFPFFFAAFAFWFADKKFKARQKHFVIAFSIISGHLAWMMIGGVILAFMGNAAASNMLGDILLVGGGLIWLVARPGFPAVAYLTIYKVVALSTQVRYLIGYDLGELLSASIMHAILNMSAIVALVSAYLKIRRVPKTTTVVGGQLHLGTADSGVPDDKPTPSP